MDYTSYREPACSYFTLGLSLLGRPAACFPGCFRLFILDIRAGAVVALLMDDFCDEGHNTTGPKLIMIPVLFLSVFHYFVATALRFSIVFQNIF